ncbi:MAG TPA: PIG-L family deacetylase [Streptosporangiaceae bacterium]|jgi:LmbE family N-acetylglucosaminyl deacetylase
MTTVLAVSPHLDDAVLSYGGRLAYLAAGGTRVLIYTVFTGTPDPPYSPSAVKLHELWRLSGDPMAPRRAEDTRALAILGATPLHGPFLDAIYRRDEHGGWVVDGSTSYRRRRMASEAALVEDVAAAVGQVIAEHGPAEVVTCSATGGHLDHVRARDATVAAARRAGTPLRCWEDLPYAVKSKHIPPLPAGVTLTGPRLEPVDAAAWQAKAQAVDCYASQHQMLMYRGRSVAELLDRHALARGRKAGDTDRAEAAWDVTPA